MSDPDLRETMFLYVLDALDAEERGDVEQRLDADDEAALEALAEAEQIADALPDALAPVVPRPESRARLLARAAASPPAAHEGDVVAFAPRRERNRAIGLGIAAAAALALVALGAIGFVLREAGGDNERLLERYAAAEARTRAAEDRTLNVSNELDATKRRLAAAERALEESERRVAALQSGSADRMDALAVAAAARAAFESRLEETVAQLERALEVERRAGDALRNRIASAESSTRAAEEQLAALAAGLEQNQQALDLVRAPDVGIVDLISPDEGSHASASVFWDRGLRHCYLHARGLPTLAGEATFALWLEYESGAVVHVADFENDGNGEGSLFADLPVGLGEIVATRVTREVGDDRDRPRGEVILDEAAAEPTGGDPRGRRKYRRRG